MAAVLTLVLVVLCIPEVRLSRYKEVITVVDTVVLIIVNYLNTMEIT